MTHITEHATQEIKKRVAAVYVLTPDGKTIAGYYTLSQYAIEAGELPPELVQQLHLPKYDKLPATLLGRLARSKQFKGGALGEPRLMGALKRALERRLYRHKDSDYRNLVFPVNIPPDARKRNINSCGQVAHSSRLLA